MLLTITLLHNYRIIYLLQWLLLTLPRMQHWSGNLRWLWLASHRLPHCFHTPYPQSSSNLNGRNHLTCSLCFVTHLNLRLWWSTATLLGNEKWDIGLIIDISLWETGHWHLSSLKTIIPFKNVSDTFVPNCVFKCVFVCRAYLFCNFFILWDKLLKT